MTEDTLKKDIALREKSRLRENVEAILVAILLALFIRTFVVQAFKIPSGSMKDTLLIGDHILVNKFIYGIKLPFFNQTLIPFRTPRKGDIIVFKFPVEPKKDFIKRVVGVAGDTIEVRDKKLFVNGVRYAHPAAVFKDRFIIPGCPDGYKPDAPCRRDNFGPVTVPDGAVFVMGDNRDQSYDSRFWGFVDTRAIKGKAFLIYWSWDKNGFGVRWNRIGDLLH